MSELGNYQLPKGWSWATIPDLVGNAGVFIDGDWVESKDQDPGGDVRLIQLADVGDGVYRDKSHRFMTKAKADELGCTFLKDGDVLVARMPDPLGRACLFPGDAKPSVTVVDVAIVRSGNGEFDHRWLACFVNAHPFRSAISSLQAGSTRKRISRGNLATIPLPVPPHFEQRRIVAEIEKQFTRLEAGLDALRRVQANLKRYRAAVLKAACEGRLVPTEAELARQRANHPEGLQEGSRRLSVSDTPGNPSHKIIHPKGVAESVAGSGTPSGCADSLNEVPGVSSRRALLNPRLPSGSPSGSSESAYETGAELLARILAERRQSWQGRGKYKEPAAPDTGKLGQLPEGWTWATAQQLNLANRPCAYGVLQPGDNIPDGVPFVRVGDINNGKVDLSNMKRISLEIAAAYPRTKLHGGELAITLVGAIGRTAIIPESLASGNTARAVGIIPLTRQANANWVEIWFRNPAKNAEMDSKSHEVARKTLNLEDVRIASVALPPLAEQTRIVAEVERRLSVVDELESVVTANLQRVTRLRQSILRKAFTGELIGRSLVLSTNVIELPKAQHNQRPHTHFARALLSAEIVHRLHREPTFGRIKHQKIFHLCEHIAQMEEIHGQYHREAAGPLDNKLIYANEAELKKQKWYQEVHREPFGHAYQPLANAGNHRKYVEGYWPDKLPLIEKLIELMRDWKTDRCEIFCTTYAAWNDLIILGKEPTEVAILREILESWHDSKKRFPEERWCKAIGWIRKEGFVPTGFGRPTKVMGRK